MSSDLAALVSVLDEADRYAGKAEYLLEHCEDLGAIAAALVALTDTQLVLARLTLDAAIDADHAERCKPEGSDE